MLEPTPHLRVSSDPLVRARSQKFLCSDLMRGDPAIKIWVQKSAFCHLLTNTISASHLSWLKNFCALWFSWHLVSGIKFASGPSSCLHVPVDSTIIILWVIAEQVYTPLRLSPEKVKKSNYISDSITRIVRGKY